MPVLLALLSATANGTGDFFGGIASRRGGPVLAVTLWMHLVGIATAAAAGPLVGGDPTTADLAWGAAAGLGGSLGVLAIYQGFAATRMGVVAPVSAVVAAAVPVGYGLISGERPGWVVMAGLIAGMVAIALVSTHRTDKAGGPVGRGVTWAILGGIGFGLLFIFFGQTEDGSGMWPVLPARLAGSVLLAAAVVSLRRPWLPSLPSRLPATAAGVLTIAGNGLFVVASQRGLLSVVSVLTAMYPAATVAWARAMLGERLSPVQVTGAVLALAAVGLIAAG